MRSFILAAFFTIAVCASAAAQSAFPGFSRADSLPADFPQPILTTADNPAPGNIFLANISPLSISAVTRSYMMMLDNSGIPIRYRKVSPSPNYVALDFEMHENGVLSYFERGAPAPLHPVIRFLDTAWTPASELRGRNLVNREQPDVIVLPNGHVVLLLWENVTMDMSSIVPGGDPEATVWEVAIQEFDTNDNLVFQWRSLEHFPPTDAYTDLKGVSVDYMHTNSIEVDRDGNFILSNRHFSDITKINRQSGEVMWRLGGKHNEFTFIGEHEENAPNYFSYQHHASLLPNGHLTLFDNGLQHTPPYSRAVEYRLDEVNKTATLVWEYRHKPDIYATANGSVQRLPNGNTLIGWGQVTKENEPSITEVRPDTSVAFELTLPKGQRSYKVFRLPWPGCPSIATVSINEVIEGNTYDYNAAGNITGAKITFLQTKGFLYNTLTVHRFACPPVNPRFSGKDPAVRPLRYVCEQRFIDTLEMRVVLDLRSVPEITDPASVTVLARDSAGRGVFLPVLTSYDAAEQTLSFVANRVGEFIFVSDARPPITPPMPTLISPPDAKKVSQLLPLTLEWSPAGEFTTSHMQASRDAAFTDLVMNDTLRTSTLTTSVFTAAQGSPEKTYYWRARSINDAGPGAWSNAWSFTTSAPFIVMRSPNGGDILRRGTSTVVRFDRNIAELLRFSLYRNGSLASVIKDSAANTAAFLWQIPAGTAVDSTYRIKVESVADGSLADMSDSAFTILAPVTGIDAADNALGGFSLSQNFPNPFSSATQIDISSPGDNAERAFLTVTDLLGRTVLGSTISIAGSGRIVISKEQLPGPGAYFYRINIGSRSRTRMMMHAR